MSRTVIPRRQKIATGTKIEGSLGFGISGSEKMVAPEIRKCYYMVRL